MLAGECRAVIDGQERMLRQWDFVHCPPGTSHAFAGGGEGPCLLLKVGARVTHDLVYSPTDLAESVDVETTSGKDAYAQYGHWVADGESPL